MKKYFRVNSVIICRNSQDTNYLGRDEIFSVTRILGFEKVKIGYLSISCLITKYMCNWKFT